MHNEHYKLFVILFKLAYFYYLRFWTFTIYISLTGFCIPRMIFDINKKYRDNKTKDDRNLLFTDLLKILGYLWGGIRHRVDRWLGEQFSIKKKQVSIMFLLGLSFTGLSEN